MTPILIREARSKSKWRLDAWKSVQQSVSHGADLTVLHLEPLFVLIDLSFLAAIEEIKESRQRGDQEPVVPNWLSLLCQEVLSIIESNPKDTKGGLDEDLTKAFELTHQLIEGGMGDAIKHLSPAALGQIACSLLAVRFHFHRPYLLHLYRHLRLHQSGCHAVTYEAVLMVLGDIALVNPDSIVEMMSSIKMFLFGVVRFGGMAFRLDNRTVNALRAAGTNHLLFHEDEDVDHAFVWMIQV